MKERIAIIDGLRTPFCKANGVLKHVDADDLGSYVVREILMRAEVKPDEIDEVIFGNVVTPIHAMNIGRVIAIKGGLPRSTPASTVSRNCASGMDSIVLGAKAILQGDAKIVLAGGTESMSKYPIVYKQEMKDFLMKFNKAKSLGERLKILASFRPSFLAPVIPKIEDPLCGLTMGETAEVLAREFHVPRKEQDRYSIQSHDRAVNAMEKGYFNEEIIPVPTGKGEFQKQDIGPRDDQSMEVLEKLKPAFDKLTGTVTAASSSQITDGAGAVLLMKESEAKKRGLKPIGYLTAYAYSGLDPKRMGLGPAFATAKVLKETGKKLAQFDLIEINEAFAAQILAVKKALTSEEFCQKELGWKEPVGHLEEDKLNVNGGAIALGHPLGASGTRIVITLLRELKRREQRLGLATLCVGGGQGEAVILEVDHG